MIIVDELLILKEIDYKENDKILHALSKNNGKIQLLSKGCKKNNSKLINSSQLFAHSRCELHKSRDVYIVSYAELINNFYSLRNNMDAFLYGSYVLELISYIAQENDIDHRIFDMTVSILYHLSTFNKDFNKLTAAYELKLASMLGYKPSFDGCLSCGSKITGDLVFSIKDGGLYCSSCEKYGNGINLNYKEIISIERILKSKFEDISSIDNINSKIMNIIRQFLFYYIGKNNFTTLKML